ncbi:MAG: membrane protein insertase YidC [Pseudomonadota bacterium]
MPEQRNLILAIALSIGIILAFQYFYEMPRMQAQQEAARQQALIEQETTAEAVRPTARPDTSAGAAAGEAVAVDAPRLTIDNGRLQGSMSLAGARLDELRLTDYRVALDPNSPLVQILAPVGSDRPEFAEFGWVAEDGVDVPDNQTLWTVVGNERLTAATPVTLRWDNGAGLIFDKQIAVDDNYMFTFTQKVTNNSGSPVTLLPYGLVSRWYTPETTGIWILHEGPIGVLNDTLEEIDYSNLREDGEIAFDSNGGWLGITDKYWLTALVPDQAHQLRATFKYIDRGTSGRWQTDYLRAAVTVAPGGSTEVVDHLFAGAKEVRLLDQYRDALGATLFDRAVDFGWFWFLTKPFFYTLHWLYVVTGNYGVAILIVTLLVKLLFFPLANKSYKAMSQMKALQPEMLKIRERHENDREKMNQEMMALYKREKVNPAAGCLPILVQIPVFFALYKVLFVSIEMRHAPFFGWIQDLSAPDPTTLFNLFGLFPFVPPAWIPLIGVWPILMGATMWLQTKLNPTPPDPIQARVMAFLPLIFVFLFATFPAGLVIYWTWNNVLSVGQQWLIMRRMNVSIT